MLKGYTAPRTPLGRSSLVQPPPWHYVGTALAVEYDARPEAVAAFLPAPLRPGREALAGRCAAYFCDWQFASGEAAAGGEPEYLDPVHSQYREFILLLTAEFEGSPCAYCPFIWVDQDASLLRGLIQGWPKQIGSIWMTRTFELASPATPMIGAGGRFGASLAAKDRRLVDARVTLRVESESMPQPNFSRAFNVRLFPELAAGHHDRPAVHELVQLRSCDVAVSAIWRGDAELRFYDQPNLELPALAPQQTVGGYRFNIALTVDDLVTVSDLRG